MNRIYQGRVTRIEAKKEDGTFEPLAFGKDQSNCPLWRHHTIFQDAVNYNLLALASLAKEQIVGANRLMTDLPKRIADSWERFPKADAVHAGARSLRDSVAPWLGLDGTATIDQAYATILDGNTVDKRALSYALALVLDECSGDSGIQQGGREYLPKLCDSDSKATYDYSASSLASGEGKDRLAVVLHGDPNLEDLKRIASEMDLSWMVKVSPGEFYEGEEAITRLIQAINHLAEMIAKPSERLAAAIAGIPNAEAEIAVMRESVKSLPSEYKIPCNRKPPSLDVLFSIIAFMAFPSRLTAACLKLGLKAPSKSDTSEKKTDGIDFAALGDDPVKLARSSRGFVFRAFTALSRWNPSHPGKPVWKEFDIAAFKEALKALNQFRLKTKEREEKKQDLEGLIAYLIGSPIKGWKPTKEESGEEAELPEALDPELLKLAWDLEEEMTQGLSESVVGEINQLSFGEGSLPIREGGWTVTRASLRGLRDILDEWKKLISKHGEGVSASDLEDAVKEYQGKEGKFSVIGSVSLFLTLCEPRFRPLWMDSDPEEGEEAGDNRFLHRLADLHESVADYLKCDEAINLTPAEPRYSRRLFMFSDMPGKSAPEYQGLDCLEVSMATEGDDVRQKRYRLRFGAPRLRRDGLLGSEDGWLQPVTKALGLKLSKSDPSPFDSAVSLMPDFDSSGSLRFLLNFAASIDAEPLREAIGKAKLWDRQLNGTKDKSIHIHWPGTADPTKMKVIPWWDNPAVIAEGFTVMATDLGQRTAGSWALLRITATKPATPRPVRSIGHDGKREWFAEILKTGMHRLPGEDAMTRGKDGHMGQELSGKTGRMASEEEWKESLELAKALLADEPVNWIGTDRLVKSYPEQNDALLRLANRRLSRLQTFHRWSCFDSEKETDPLRKDSLIKKLIAELDQWEDDEVARWAGNLHSGDIAAFRSAAGSAFASYRSGILPHLVALANRVAPLREDHWQWKQRGGDSPYGDLVRIPRGEGAKPPVRGQRGLSLARIEQMENLRRLFLRYNRALDREAGKPAKFGRADTGRDSGEPCRDLLEKIDRIKEQRVDQTAHLILSQALGVKLAPHGLSAQARQEGDHHGEYTLIPGREPVDLVVIEDLGRYLSSQGRAPSENSRLMKWAHRAVRDKVKMLIEEPFGIPVLEVPAAYSSRFCAVTGEAGARCEERAELDDYLREILERRSVTPVASGQRDPREANLRLLMQFKLLDAINASRRSVGKCPVTLLLQKTGGPLFVGAGEQSCLVQSDMNAAINLAFRAIAAPEAVHLLHRIRTEKTGDQITTLAKNRREIAVFGKKGRPISMEGETSAKLSKSANFFHDPAQIAKFDRGEITLGGKTIPIASGIGLWHAVNGAILPKIVKINEDRLRRYGLAEVWKLSKEEEVDNIPM